MFSIAQIESAYISKRKGLETWNCARKRGVRCKKVGVAMSETKGARHDCCSYIYRLITLHNAFFEIAVIGIRRLFSFSARNLYFEDLNVPHNLAASCFWRSIYEKWDTGFTLDIIQLRFDNQKSFCDAITFT